MIPNFGIREGESVYDFDWYPLMNSQGKARVNCLCDLLSMMLS